MKRLVQFQIKEIDSVRDFDTNYVNSFIGVVIQANSGSIDVAFDNTIVNLVNHDIRETCKVGIGGRLFVLMDTPDQGRLIAFSPFSKDQIKRYHRLLKVEINAQ